MNGPLRYLLLVVALLFAQHAAMLHGLAHAKHDLALAAQHDGKTPALGHGCKACAAFGALAHALGGAGTAHASVVHAFDEFILQFQNAPAVTRVAFASRAPPALS